ncbi:MAG TPA: efflux RND transporter periplasmic adaptor subunit [Paludibacter sp.]|nr:efflux RND transporter periplasmic adaptor subunit [Paludibacter sp.]
MKYLFKYPRTATINWSTNGRMSPLQFFVNIVLFLFLVSCGGTPDKKAELEKLKSQREELNARISKLENELNPGAEKDDVKPLNVNVTELEKTVFNHYIEVQGTVDADENIAVSPQIGGVVTAVYVKEGSRVGRGQVVAELDSRVLEQSLEEIRTQLDLANSMYQKQSALWDKKIGSEVQYLQAKTNKESLEKRLKTMKEQLRQTKIVSPISGTVESVPLRVGQMASPGVPGSAIRVINMNTAKITADVSEAYAARIRDGNPVIVSFPDIGKEVGAKLSFTSRFIDPTNRTFKVECKIQASGIELRANMIANVKIMDYSNKDALSIPVNVVQKDQNGKFVYVGKYNGKYWVADKRMIQTGKDYAGQVEVVEGLMPGDKLITSGYQNLNVGEKIVF